jgi:hypothetical protein
MTVGAAVFVPLAYVPLAFLIKVLGPTMATSVLRRAAHLLMAQGSDP